MLFRSTPLERNNPKVLNGTRRARIAKGSGRQVSEVNKLVERFEGAQKMMKAVRSGNVPGLPKGMQLPPGMSLPPAQKSGKTPPKKKSRSGNPAKRALEEGN